MKPIFFIYIFLFNIISYSQNQSLKGIDSLKTVFKNEKKIESKAAILENIVTYYLKNNLDSAQVYITKTIKFSEKNKILFSTEINLLEINFALSKKDIATAKEKIKFFKNKLLLQCNRKQWFKYKLTELKLVLLI